MLNKQGSNKIDWTDYTWNPQGGCLFKCPYCYMRAMAARFQRENVPVFREDYLKDPGRLVAPSKIFVGSSGDMFGDWVVSENIEKILQVERDYSQHTFQHLTKNPERYYAYDFPRNAWLGTTVDGLPFTKFNIGILLDAAPDNRVRFISFEPLIQIPEIVELEGIDWIIIGADSTRGARRPPDAWADGLIEKAREVGAAVWVKDNYHYSKRIKEFPIDF